jgi:hypothetical protein
VREERVVLEDESHVAQIRRQVVDGAPVDAHRSRALAHEPGDHAQQRRLAAAGGAEQRHDLARPDGQRDVVDRRDMAVAVGHRVDVERVPTCARHARLPTAASVAQLVHGKATREVMRDVGRDYSTGRRAAASSLEMF